MQENNIKIRKIKGWFDEEDLQLFDFVMTKVNSDIAFGNIAEVGIYYGKSLAKLATYARTNEKIVGIDAYIGTREQYNEIFKNIQSVSKCQVNDINIVRQDSYKTDVASLGSSYYHNCKVVHIDGNHSGINVYHDLELADHLMNDFAVLILDDWNNKFYPHIQEAFYTYVAKHPGSFEKFLISNRKCYLCRPNRLSSWLWHTETQLPEFLKATPEGKHLLSLNTIIKTENYLNNSTIVMFDHNDPINTVDHAYVMLHSKYDTIT